MKIWIVKQEWSGKYLPIVNSWKPRYGGFDYRISTSDTEEVEVVAECEAAVRWLPHIRAGIEDYCEQQRKEGELYQGIKISLTRIYEHEVDTAEIAMQCCGAGFLIDMTGGYPNAQFESTEVQAD